MYFFERKGWYCQFLEEDCRTPLPKKLNFKHPDKIIELAQSDYARLTAATAQRTLRFISIHKSAE